MTNKCEKCGVDGDHLAESPAGLSATLWYPRNGGPQHVVVGLCDVRAADDLRIRYDFDRDGWVVEQPQYGTWATDEEHMRLGYGWVEVGFFQAWGKEDKTHRARVMGDEYA